MIAITRADGGVELLYLVAGVNAQEEVNKWKAARPNEYVSHREVTTIPTDRTFRNAWKPDLSVDMGKAREIQRERLGERARIEAIKALQGETDDPAIEAAATPEALKAVTGVDK